jgi:two-component system phosphate regulon sensor histidine kinase PhoR
MENHGSRPEIVRAFAGDVGVQSRFSNTLQKTMIYVAIPIRIDGETVGAMRTSYPITAVEQALTTLHQKLLIGGLIIAALATIMSLIIFRRLARPLIELQAGAERFAKGELRSRLPMSDFKEIAALAVSMNKMAADLDARIRTITQQRNEREAILSSMSEGVMALDAKERIASFNKAAERFLDIDPELGLGRPLREVLRIAGLHSLVERTLSGSERSDMEVTVSDGTERCLQVHATALNDAAGERIGVVLVFRDITRLKKLEAVRRDFVANVSHELKTPITAITGSVETLIDGAMNDPEDNRRFLRMIAKHADRLNSLVEDLLSLARLETVSERRESELTRNAITPILESSVQACHENASRRQVTVECHCDPNLQADVSPAQLEQAVANLIDNAIKYSDPGTAVTVKGDTAGDEIVISVLDHGCGIEQKHLPRLFERFYRVDKARDRDVGGTGLGLAIVKHVALAHGGRVSVDSQPGHGSTFRLHLPKP